MHFKCAQKWLQMLTSSTHTDNWPSSVLNVCLMTNEIHSHFWLVCLMFFLYHFITLDYIWLPSIDETSFWLVYFVAWNVCAHWALFKLDVHTVTRFYAKWHTSTKYHWQFISCKGSNKFRIFIKISPYTLRNNLFSLNAFEHFVMKIAHFSTVDARH